MSVTIVYDTDTLILPNPNYGNSETHNLQTKFQMAMSGKMYSYIKTPVTKKLFMIFTALTSTNINEIKTFIKDNIYQTVILTDWDNVDWTGKILSNPLETIKPNRGFFSMILEFEGQKV